ncbi:hypothetical protein J6590_006581 [Homalodisca vitripennis]|nr:hypothetical protein J6590_006581 [Homalodisca vitripennis]
MCAYDKEFPYFSLVGRQTAVFCCRVQTGVPTDGREKLNSWERKCLHCRNRVSSGRFLGREYSLCLQAAFVAERQLPQYQLSNNFIFSHEAFQRHRYHRQEDEYLIQTVTLCYSVRPDSLLTLILALH